jgi:hypothetical protein
VVKGGYGAITAAMAAGLDIRMGNAVASVKHTGGEGDSGGVIVTTAAGEAIHGAVCVVTVGPGSRCSPRHTGMAFPDSDGFGRGSDSGGFGRIPSSPAGVLFCGILQSSMGILTLQTCIPDSDGFGRGSDSDGFLNPKYVNHQTRRHTTPNPYLSDLRSRLLWGASRKGTSRSIRRCVKRRRVLSSA